MSDEISFQGSPKAELAAKLVRLPFQLVVRAIVFLTPGFSAPTNSYRQTSAHTFRGV